jgi:hypothetical protein
MKGEHESECENEIAAAIDAAEDVRDPLDGLVEKTATDPGAPFAPEVLERLAALKKANRAAFETLRAQLKKTGCARQSHRRRERRHGPRSNAGRHPDRTCANR